ncbi:pimeloyl-ACP methyl ester carboxylesterase [Rhodoligotrophos appendicifer]|uniref:alpha/beta fold hydrolase n=1 Tax=Rhodoligotrophos appendicifer TaxID=987056 RepID=UPI00118694C0|nr:alpha/beta hydrolase [Rhodoligotrophos appendicifer]
MSGIFGAVAVKPAYVATSHGQLRYWRAGAGLPLVVLPGMILGAAPRARQCAAEFSDHSVITFELPGIGASASGDDGLDGAARILAEAWAVLELGDAPLLAYDLAAPLAAALYEALSPKPSALFAADLELAQAWAKKRARPPALAPRPDGAHLTALWAFIRNRHLLDPQHPSLPAAIGAPLPSDEDLDETVVNAATRPEHFERLWNACLDGIAGLDDGRAATLLEDIPMPAMIDKRLAELAVKARAPTGVRQKAQPDDTRSVWCDYVETPPGHIHVRRAGGGSRPLMMFQSAPGSTAPLTPIIEGLGTIRDVYAPDFLGNGRSDKPHYEKTDIAALAGDALDLADSLGLETLDLWGTHTGACVALELALLAPERVGRMILEAPPLLPPTFTADILENYLPPLAPDRWGLHLQQAWNMRRDMFLFWPWYRQARSAVRTLGVPETDFLHDWVIGLLSSGLTYDRSYRAAFEYDTQARLPLLTRPAMICAGPADMLVEGLRVAEQISPAGTLVTPTPATIWYPGQTAAAVEQTLQAYRDFLEDGPIR